MTALAISIGAGCAVPLTERRFDAPAETVSAAAVRALHRWHELVTVRDGRWIETQWFEIDPGTSEGILFGRPDEGRARIAAEIESEGLSACRVAVFVRAERRRAAGSRANRFERTEPPGGLADAAMDAIAAEVERGEGAR